eukprot:ANDGO_06330.mRNA.1 DNA-directed RNA polymerase III subunit rpc6
MSLESRILDSCRRHHPALAQDTLLSELSSSTSHADIVASINSLIQRGRLQVIRAPNDQILYKEVSEETAQKFRGLTAEDMLVYQIIESSASQGIWTRHIKTRSNLQQTQLNKILKNLESRRLVKQVKSIEAKTRKVYMLFDLEPSRDLTGGPWYSEQDFDSAFVDDLLLHIYKYIQARKHATASQIAEFIRASGITTVDLRDADVQALIQALVWDGRIVETFVNPSTFGASASSATASASASGSAAGSAAGSGPGSRKSSLKDGLGVSAAGGSSSSAAGALHYKVAGYYLEADALTEVPCASCPVFDVCSPNGDVNPQTCVYYNTWLKLEADEPAPS